MTGFAAAAAFLFLASGLSAPASELRQFDLNCHGVQHSPDPSQDNKPTAGVFSVDLDAMIWCVRESCAKGDISQIVEQTPTTVVFDRRDGKGLQASFIYDRQSGAYTQDIRASSIKFEVSVKGSCTVEAYTPIKR